MKRVIFLLFDGARPDVLENLAREGKLPNIYERFYKAGVGTKATTVFPSTTGPAYLPFITGQFPGVCNIPGIRWLDRTEFNKSTSSHAGRRSYVGYENSFFNRDLNPDVKTLYDEVSPCFSINSIITRGLEKTSFMNMLPQSLLMLYAKLSHHWKPVDAFAERHFFKALKESYKFFFVSFLRIDEESHLSHPFSDSSIAAYQYLDTAVGRLFNELEKAGTLKDTLVMVSSDHGLTATDKHFELWKWFEDRGRRVFYYPHIFKSKVDAACMVSGNAMANMYFKSGGAAGTSWEPHTYHAELEALGFVKELAREPAIDHVITRIDDYTFGITRGEAFATITKKDRAIDYTVVTQDPFGYPPLPKSMTYDEVLKLTFDTDYPDALVQIAQIFDSPRTGDMLVTSKLGYDLRIRFEIPEHHGSHGSFHKEHMLVPLLANQPIFDKNQPHRTIDVYEKIRAHLK